MKLTRSKLALLLAAVYSSSFSASLWAQESLNQAQSVQSKTNAASASSQKNIDKSAEQSLELRGDIERLQEEVKNMKVYRDHLSALVKSQEGEADSLAVQIEEIKDTRQGIVPLMYSMLDGLKSIVSNDKPIKLAQRQQRIEKLESLMTRADVSDAEKYRRILEAYQIEMDYGTKLDAYQGEVDIDGQTRQADILHLGRISLVARNFDQSEYWAWNQKTQTWQSVDASLQPEINKAFSVAMQQSAPSLLTLPVSLAKGEAN